MSKYLLQVVVVDEQPGRARVKARDHILDALGLYRPNAGQLRLEDENFSLVSATVSEVVE